MRSLRKAHARLPLRNVSRLLSTTTPASSSSTTASTTSTTTTTTTPITSLLIANRGEIALRIRRTATRLGIPTTTIYTDVDKDSQHVAASPSSIALGSDPRAYLDGDRIASLAARHRISALHPGYGFLSENAAFARLCADRGINFVGPPPQAMADMGDKARSKELMTAAGVPCVPGYHGPDQDPAFLQDRAAEITYPVLLKSVKGGGGKGMRIVRSADEFPAQLRSARAEARASFGPDGEVMLVEKYIERPRHVEFILDRDTDRFYFMEMNTRLQVEHPVSEMVTGTDLVEWQLRVAAGEPLPLTQDEIEARIRGRGAAIEARIYAENPEKGFLPDSGRLVHLATPRTDTDSKAAEDADVRIDAGFVEGDTVSQAYDGMIAKLIVRGRDRETAIRRLELALREYEVVGLSTNIEFLKRLCRSPAFVEGDLDTGFIERWRDDLFAPRRVEDEVFVQAALALAAASSPPQAAPGPHGETLGFGDAGASTGDRRFAFKVTDGYAEQPAEGAKEDVVEVVVTQRGGGLFNARVSRDGEETPREFDNITTGSSSSTRNSTKTTVRSLSPLARIESTVVRDPTNGDRITVFQLGTKTELALAQPPWYEEALGLKEAAASVVAPMPCKILRNEVGEGDVVEKGTPLVVIESMKMETVIRSPQDGVIKKLAHKEGDICKAGTVLVLFEEAEEAS
ncbi:hypothetical protein RB600_006241 [Gaeumannomyces tritici]